MKVWDGKRYFTLFYMLGFFVGILYANIPARNYIISTGIFTQFYMEQYADVSVNTEDYFLYLIRVRVFPLILVGVAACTKFRKGVASLILLWTGFSSGMIFTASAMKIGVKGIILCLISLLPHFLFYVAAYIIILWFLFQYPRGKWTVQKTTAVCLFVVTGMILECYVNPVLVKLFLKLFSL